MAASRGQTRWTDSRMDAILGNLLRTGVTVAGAVVLVGAIVYLVRHGQATPDYHSFRGEPADLCSVAGVMADVCALRGRGIIQFGFLLLIATPVARVAISCLVFAFQRDRIYVVVSVIVLGLLLFSLVGG
jgi:uncharacterized membrane protein